MLRPGMRRRPARGHPGLHALRGRSCGALGCAPGRSRSLRTRSRTRGNRERHDITTGGRLPQPLPPARTRPPGAGGAPRGHAAAAVAARCLHRRHRIDSRIPVPNSGPGVAGRPPFPLAGNPRSPSGSAPWHLKRVTASRRRVTGIRFRECAVRLRCPFRGCGRFPRSTRMPSPERPPGRLNHVMSNATGVYAY
jgi:hypothetical protein